MYKGCLWHKKIQDEHCNTNNVSCVDVSSIYHYMDMFKCVFFFFWHRAKIQEVYECFLGSSLQSFSSSIWNPRCLHKALIRNVDILNDFSNKKTLLKLNMTKYLMSLLVGSRNKMYSQIWSYLEDISKVWFGLWCLMPLSTIFQL